MGRAQVNFEWDWKAGTGKGESFYSFYSCSEFENSFGEFFVVILTYTEKMWITSRIHPRGRCRRKSNIDSVEAVADRP